MLIPFDQGTPVPIRRALIGHAVKTAREQGWSTLANGDLLRAAEEAGFELLLTTDTNFPYQQRLQNRKLAVVILTRSKWNLVRTVLPTIVEAVNVAKPGTFTIVEVPQGHGAILLVWQRAR
jgi:hypothetical protein